MVEKQDENYGIEFPTQDSLQELLQLLKIALLSVKVDDFEDFKKEIVKRLSIEIDQQELMRIGIIALKTFIQECWTGPPIKGFDFEISEGLNMLENDGEPAYPLTPYPILLIIALAIFESDLVSHHKFLAWWRLRAYFIHQKILENPTGSLYDAIMDQINQIRLPELDDSSRNLHTRYHMELGMVYHYYKYDSKAKEQFVSAQTVSKFQWSVTGYLGKRTKFQTFDVSQLAVVAKSLTPDVGNAQEMPNKLDLNDDTLLEAIKFTDANEIEEKLLMGSLNAIDQSILLAFCLNIKNTNPADGLTSEEMRPFVSRVLENPNNWMIYTMALLLRSRLESNRSRTVERSVLQLQALVDQFPLEESPVSEKLLYFFCIDMPAKWEMEKELAERFISIGVVRSALEIFERLALWEDAISCYQMMEEYQKAEKLALKLLEESPKSPKIHCILGDLQREPKHYETAWALSGGRYARAMRSLGAYHFKKEEYQQSIECYHKALAINPLYENSWFVMACAAMKIEEWDIAVKALHRVTSLDSENGEAWNNLASVFIKQKKKREAWRALREALRSKHDASNIWENYLFVSIDLCEIQEAIRAMEMVLNLRIDRIKDNRKLVDIPVLSILVDLVIDKCNNKDSKDFDSCKLLSKRLNNLFELLISKLSYPEIFLEASRFYEYQGLYRKSLEFHQKAYRAHLHDPYLLDNKSSFELLAIVTMQLVDRYFRIGSLLETDRAGEETIVCKDWNYQSRTCLKTVIGRTKAIYEDEESHRKLVDRLEKI